MRLFIRSGIAARATALAAGSLIAFGTALPASEASTAPSVKITAGATSGTVAVSSGSCTESIHYGIYLNQYGYDTVKVYFSAPPQCGAGLEAAATCSGYNFWGHEVYGEDSPSYASCDQSHPTFQHGGFRFEVSGIWYYYTYKITS